VGRDRARRRRRRRSAPRTAQFGDPGGAGDPPLARALEARGEAIGELRVAPRPGADRAEREALLAFIAPTLAIALQNALSYQALADYPVQPRAPGRSAHRRAAQARDQLAGTVVELREAQGARGGSSATSPTRSARRCR